MRTGKGMFAPVSRFASALSFAASKSDSRNTAGCALALRYWASLVIPGRHIRTIHCNVELRSPSLSSPLLTDGTSAPAASSSTFRTLLVTSLSPATANWNAMFAGMKRSTFGFSPAHSHLMTLDVYARIVSSAALASTVFLHAGTVSAHAVPPACANVQRMPAIVIPRHPMRLPLDRVPFIILDITYLPFMLRILSHFGPQKSTAAFPASLTRPQHMCYNIRHR